MKLSNSTKALIRFTMCLSFFSLVSVFNMYASSGGGIVLTGIDSMMNTAIAFFRSFYIRGAATIALGFSIFGMIINRQDRNVVQKILPVLIASAALVSIGGIIDIVLPKDQYSDSTFKSGLNFDPK